ncbi:MAG: phospholipase, partial [Gammaproteobacteria bacterium]
YPVEPARVYLTGINMGGVGAWELGTGDPDVFAALVPICGGGDPHRADRLVTKRGAKPVWLFHSARDRAMPVEGSDRIFDGLRARDGYVTYTRYDDLDHVQTWERAYGSSVLYDWLLAHSLPGSEEYAATDLQ